MKYVVNRIIAQFQFKSANFLFVEYRRQRQFIFEAKWLKNEKRLSKPKRRKKKSCDQAHRRVKS